MGLAVSTIAVQNAAGDFRVKGKSTYNSTSELDWMSASRFDLTGASRKARILDLYNQDIYNFNDPASNDDLREKLMMFYRAGQMLTNSLRIVVEMDTTDPKVVKYVYVYNDTISQENTKQLLAFLRTLYLEESQVRSAIATFTDALPEFDSSNVNEVVRKVDPNVFQNAFYSPDFVPAMTSSSSSPVRAAVASLIAPLTIPTVTQLGDITKEIRVPVPVVETISRLKTVPVPDPSGNTPINGMSFIRVDFSGTGATLSDVKKADRMEAKMRKGLRVPPDEVVDALTDVVKSGRHFLRYAKHVAFAEYDDAYNLNALYIRASHTPTPEDVRKILGQFEIFRMSRADVRTLVSNMTGGGRDSPGGRMVEDILMAAYVPGKVPVITSDPNAPLRLLLVNPPALPAPDASSSAAKERVDGIKGVEGTVSKATSGNFTIKDVPQEFIRVEVPSSAKLMKSFVAGSSLDEMRFADLKRALVDFMISGVMVRDILGLYMEFDGKAYASAKKNTDMVKVKYVYIPASPQQPMSVEQYRAIVAFVRVMSMKRADVEKGLVKFLVASKIESTSDIIAMVMGGAGPEAFFMSMLTTIAYDRKYSLKMVSAKTAPARVQMDAFYKSEKSAKKSAFGTEDEEGTSPVTKWLIWSVVFTLVILFVMMPMLRWKK